MFQEGKGYTSLQVSAWPKYNSTNIDATAERDGDQVIAIMSEIRRDKAEKKLPLNAPIKNLAIYTNDQKTADAVEQGCIDIAATLKIEKINVSVEQQPKGRQVAQYEIYIKPEY
jgi:valyl-tRNA synthetase